MKKKYYSALLPILLLLLASLLALSAVTYAWFSFQASTTKITPMEGKISDGDPTLLISLYREKNFDVRCPLKPELPPGKEQLTQLLPVSTVDLSRFYTSTTQDPQGYSVAFREVTDLSQWLIYGKVYLKCIGGECRVYFQEPGPDLGTDPQFLASGRLGLRITREDGSSQAFLFRLDSLGDTGDAQSRDTVHAENSVISGLSGSAPVFSPDPSVSIQDYLPEGEHSLCTLKRDEIAMAEYWVYLEGCDTECYNPVQSRNLTLQLSFTGDPVEEKAAED